ncbi:aldo/keto reductase [Streptomyces sp. NPDC048462]|uniref:aldo/keto reductase n=1 Tax=Streptomyces sp. NPDC048462 TaxID=3365555 RepID=UPI003722AF52
MGRRVHELQEHGRALAQLRRARTRAGACTRTQVHPRRARGRPERGRQRAQGDAAFPGGFASAGSEPSTWICTSCTRGTPSPRPRRSCGRLDDLVSSGKVRYVALSDVPAWYAARAQTLAEWRGYEPLVALQLEYSLAERGLEYEFPSLAQELGMGLMTWGPLAKGLLSGKYSADAPTAADLPEGRLKVAASTGTMADNRSERNWRIVTELGKVAQEIGRSPAQVALNWVANRPAVGSVILGASKAAQIRSNLDALDFALPEELRARLDEVSAPPRAAPYAFVDSLQARLNGQVRNKRPGYYAGRGRGRAGLSAPAAVAGRP